MITHDEQEHVPRRREVANQIIDECRSAAATALERINAHQRDVSERVPMRRQIEHAETLVQLLRQVELMEAVVALVDNAPDGPRMRHLLRALSGEP